jgi:hypothetical protein
MKLAIYFMNSSLVAKECMFREIIVNYFVSDINFFYKLSRIFFKEDFRFLLTLPLNLVPMLYNVSKYDKHTYIAEFSVILLFISVCYTMTILNDNVTNN